MRSLNVYLTSIPTTSGQERRAERFAVTVLLTWVALAVMHAVPSRAQCLPKHTITGAASDYLGTSVAGAGDVNNDGFDDFIVGAPQNNTGGTKAGQAYVYSGRDGTLLYTFTGTTSGGIDGDQLGSSVDGAGDVDADGYDDVIVGAANYSVGGLLWRGIARVYSGRTGAVLHTFTGEGYTDHLGRSVAGAGDVNSDGVPDVIIGARGAGVPPDPQFFDDYGKAYVYSGLTGELLFSFQAEAQYDYLGSSVDGAGDVNNDGHADLIVGAHGSDAGGINSGRAYLFSGFNGALIRRFTGAGADDELGASVSGAGDVNNDGYADVIVGAPFNSAGGEHAGRAYAYSGVNGSLLHAFTAEAPQDFMGWSVAGAGDVNADGYDDMIVGADANDEGGEGAGKAYVFSGFNGSRLYSFVGSVIELFGNAVASAGDLNADGTNDVIIGAWLSPAGGDFAGRAYVYLLGDTDGDGVHAGCDNCPTVANPGQEDTNNDGVGDACQCVCPFHGNIDGNGMIDAVDLALQIEVIFFSAPDPQDPSCPATRADFNADGSPDAVDLAALIDHIFFSGPAPTDPCVP